MSLIKSILLVVLMGTAFVLVSPLIARSKVYTLAEKTYQDTKPIVKNFVKNSTVAFVLPDLLPVPPPLDADGLIDVINEIRSKSNLSELKVGPQTCALLQDYQKKRQLIPARVTALCPSCQKLQILAVSEPLSTESARAFFVENATASAAVSLKDYTNICASDTGKELLVDLVVAAKMPQQTSVVYRVITEDEMWKALSEYRKDQGKSQLTLDDKMCQYARKRVNDHIQLLASNKPKADYPNPAKYPLDAHDGFKKDADSGFVFQLTGRTEVAENLAYWPNAEYAAHVIEWGWDQSKEGHRETQLSNEYSVACITGKDGFFVAEFGK